MKYILKIIVALLLYSQLYAGGFIIVPPTGTQTALLLEEKKKSVSISIFDQKAVTITDQTFYNPSNSRLEAYFVFPIPKGAVIDNFSMDVNGKQTSAELLDATKATKIYEDIVRSMKDPALLEYSGQGLFRVKIFPIEPHSEKTVKFTYTEMLGKDNGSVYYSYQVNEGSNKSKALDNFSLKADIKSTSAIKNVYCPTHETEIVRKSDNNVIIGYENKNKEIQHDFQLYYHTGNNTIEASLLTFKEGNDDGYFCLDLSPGFKENNIATAKDVTFVLDVSGSMTDGKLEKAQAALKFCVSSLNATDRFDVIRFSTEANSCFGKLVEFNPSNLASAKKYIDDLRAIGGTNIEEALTLALKNTTTEQRPHMIVFITDGQPTIGEQKDDVLVSKIKTINTKNIRIFSMGIGYDVNTHLLDRFTEETNSYSTYITPKEDIEIKVSNFYTKVNSPVMTDISIEFFPSTGIEEIYPKTMPDLFKGNSFTLFGRFKNTGERKTIIKGKINGKAVQYEYDLNFNNSTANNNFIPKLWATRAVGYLLNEIRLHGESTELKIEVARIAKQHGIITPYTSYLIIEDQSVAINRNGGLNQPVPTQLFHEDFNSESKSEMLRDYTTIISKEKSGKAAVGASKKATSMNNASNLSISYTDQVKTTADKDEEMDMLNYTAEDGSEMNLASQNSMINGRAFYNNGSQWIDIKTETTKTNLNMIKLKFASDEYFKFLQSNTAASPYFALGNNVKFVYNGNIIEIYE